MTGPSKSRRAALLAAAVVLAGMALSGPAQPKPQLQPSITDCGSKPSDSNQDWQKCEAAFIEKDRAKLRQAEDELLAAMPKDSQSDFRAEEAAWTAYAAKACRFYFNGDWGRDGQVVQGPVCIDGVIVSRTKELRTLKTFLTHYEQAP